MIRSLELMASFHAMCECDTYREIFSRLGKTREDVEAVVSELEMVLGKRLIYRRPEGDVVSSFSGKFFMPTDAGMRWYLLIGEMLSSFGHSKGITLSLERIVEGLLNDLYQSEKNKVGSKSLLSSTVIVISFHGVPGMENLRVFTNDFLSFHFLEPVLTKLVRQHKFLNFEVFGSESEHLSEFDAYFLGYEMPLKGFQYEMIKESRIGLYASSDYLERAGEPKKLKDLLNHNIIRCKDTHVVQALGVRKFGTVKEYVPLFYKQQCIEVDSANSQLNLGEIGLGLVPMTDLLYKKLSPKLLRIAPLEGEDEFIYRRYTFGYHQKHTSDPVVKELFTELRDMLLS